MKTLKITTAELAKICSVSQGTVDRALNNRDDIKAETKQKILEIARRYGYRKTLDAQDGGIKGQIGIIVFNLNNEYFCDLITETEYVLREKALGTVIMMSHYDKLCEIESIRNLYNMGVQGIVLCSINSGKEFENYLKMFDIPIVAVGNKVDCLPYVGVDDFAAMRDMTLRVVEEGYENIIYFSPAINYPDAYAQRLRYEGFLNAIGDRKYSVVTDSEDIRETYEGKTAVICSNDYYALKVYFKAKNVTVTGFDNISAIGKYKADIKSVGYSMSEIAKRAVQIITGEETDGKIVKHFLT